MKNKQNFNGRAFSRNFVSSRYFCKKSFKTRPCFSLVSDFKKKTEEKFIFTLKNLLPLFALQEILMHKRNDQKSFFGPLKTQF